MRNAFRIFRRDMKRLLRSPAAVLVMIGVCIIPSLYAWFNIAANIDPYSNTSGIKVAVANNDKDATSNDLTINAGNEIIKNLKENDGMFLYKVLNSQEYEVVNKTLQSKTQQGRHITYVTTDDENYASDYLIGKESDTIVINGWGYALSLLESKWGYLFCIVIVSLLLFLQEAFELAMELKYGEGSKKKQAAQAVQTETATKKTSTQTKTKTATKKTATQTKKKTATTAAKKVVKTNDANQSDVKEG